MARWNRARVSTAAAVLLHGLCIAAAASLPDAPRLWMRPLQRIEPLVELEIEVEPSPARELAATGEGRRIASVASLQPGQRPAEAAEPPEAEPLGLEPEASEPAPEPAPERRRPTLAEIGVGTPPPFRLVELERAPTRKQALARRVDQMLAAGLAERDLERGHGAHGSVMSALETASFSARTPERGSALFMARIERGRVWIQVLEATEDRAAWQEAAEGAMRALRGRKLRLPAGARGVEVTIRVTSNVELPSGADPGLEVRALGIPVKKGAGKKSSRLEILTPHVDVGTTKIPNPGGGEPIELPTLELGLGVLGLHGDPSDVGATPRRMVHARVESQKLVPREPAER